MTDLHGIVVRQKSQSVAVVHSGHAVGEHIGVAGRFWSWAAVPPLSETQPEDEDAHRKAQQEVGKGESGDQNAGGFLIEAWKKDRKEGGVRGTNGRRHLDDGGGRVDLHFVWFQACKGRRHKLLLLFIIIENPSLVVCPLTDTNKYHLHIVRTCECWLELDTETKDWNKHA